MTKPRFEITPEIAAEILGPQAVRDLQIATIAEAQARLFDAYVSAAFKKLGFELPSTTDAEVIKAFFEKHGIALLSAAPMGMPHLREYVIMIKGEEKLRFRQDEIRVEDVVG